MLTLKIIYVKRYDNKICKKILKSFPLEFLEIVKSFKIFVSNSNDDLSFQCIICK